MANSDYLKQTPLGADPSGLGSGPGPEQRPDFGELFGMLDYNQGLVEFADQKAGSLILLNSLLIAAAGTLEGGGYLGVLKLASMLMSAFAVYLCFQVITSRGGGGDESSSEDDSPLKKPRSATGWQANDFVFFDCVTRNGSGSVYAEGYRSSQPENRERALLERTYIVAGIAKRKFGQCRQAQQATFWALVVWVGVSVLPLIERAVLGEI